MPIGVEIADRVERTQPARAIEGFDRRIGPIAQREKVRLSLPRQWPRLGLMSRRDRASPRPPRPRRQVQTARSRPAIAFPYHRAPLRAPAAPERPPRSHRPPTAPPSLGIAGPADTSRPLPRPARRRDRSPGLGGPARLPRQNPPRTSDVLGECAQVKIVGIKVLGRLARGAIDLRLGAASARSHRRHSTRPDPAGRRCRRARRRSGRPRYARWSRCRSAGR